LSTGRQPVGRWP